MPSPKPRISTSESATLARLEATSTTRPVRVSWNARSQPCAAAITSMNGAPSAAMRNHVSASCSEALSSEPAISRSAGPATISSTTRQSVPSANASQVACTPTSSASSRWPGAVEARRLGRRAVLEERAQADDLGEQRAGDREARQRRAPEVPDDRRVAEHVERLGRERAERRQRERDHLARPRHLVRARTGRYSRTRSFAHAREPGAACARSLRARLHSSRWRRSTSTTRWSRTSCAAAARRSRSASATRAPSTARACA